MTKWTENEIPDQSGRTILITGANSGIGFETARALAKKGATVIMACRDLQKADEAQKQLMNETPNARLDILELDLADLNAIHHFVEIIQKSYTKLDVLINNAGIMIPPYTKTRQGFELQFGTNFLGHFALTGLLFPLINKTENSRIVTVSSLAGANGKIDFNDLHSEHKPYKKWEAYGQSKLADLIFSLELARRLNKSNSKAISLGTHPGGSTTNLQRTTGFFFKNILFPLLSQTPHKAALTSLRAACDPLATNGSYWGPSGFGGLKGAPEQVKIPKPASDKDVAKRLWKVGEELTGVTYRFE